MPAANEDKSFKILGIIFVCALLLFGVLAGLKLLKKNGQGLKKARSKPKHAKR